MSFLFTAASDMSLIEAKGVGFGQREVFSVLSTRSTTLQMATEPNMQDGGVCLILLVKPFLTVTENNVAL